MAAPRNAIERWGQYLAARSVVAAAQVFDIDVNLRTAAFLGRRLSAVGHRHRNRAAEAIRAAFPDASDAWVHAVSQQAFEHFMELVVEAMQLPRLLHADNWMDRVTVSGLKPTVEAAGERRPFLCVTGHLGSWEALGFINALLGFQRYVVARRIDNPLINRWLIDVRQRKGMRVLDKFDVVRVVDELLGAGESIGFVADQNGGDKGMFVPFFGRLASTHKSIALLAIRHNVPIFCGMCLRMGHNARYHMEVTDVIQPRDWAAAEDPAFYITARFMHAIEQQVRRCPGQYLWLHRRWKSRPRWERDGKPMPDSHLRKLSTLPWLDGAAIDRLARSAQ